MCCFSVRLFIACFLRGWLTSTPTKWDVCGREGYQALWGGGHPRLRNHASRHATPHNNPTLFAFMDRWDSHPFTWWVLGKRLRLPPFYDAHNTCSGNLNPPTKHHNHNHQGDNSLRHPSNGVCGRESCQEWGGRAPTPARPLNTSSRR